MATPGILHPRSFHLNGLRGISDETLRRHVKWYEDQVDRLNSLTEQLHQLAQGLLKPDAKRLTLRQLTYRLGVEYTGIVLHEHYFANLKPGGGETEHGPAFVAAAQRQFGSYEAWKTDFISIGLLPEVGWAICYRDPANKGILNCGMNRNHNRSLVGYTPILVMDMWDHAFELDYPLSQRALYIDAFFANVDWQAVDQRLLAAVPVQKNSGRVRQKPSPTTVVGVNHAHN